MSKKLMTISHQDLPVLDEYPVPGCKVSGLRAATFAEADDYSLWLCVADLEPGAELTLDANHGDQGIYVEEGELLVGAQVCPTGGAVVIESGVPVTIQAPKGGRIYHNGPVEPSAPEGGLFGSPDPAGHCVHVVGPKGWFQSGTKENVVAIWFADSTCPTCRIAMFTVARQKAHDRVGRPHSHSQDELIHIITGKLRLGAIEYGPGTSLIIPADVHYAVSGDFGLKFLNYRRDTSLQTFYDQDRETEGETGLSRGGVEVRDLVNIPA